MSARRPAPDRRAVIGGSLALASAVAASAAPGTAASAPSPADAKLLDLGRQLAAAELRLQELDRAGDDAFEHYEPAPVPRALFCSPADRRTICRRPDVLAMHDIDGERQHSYEGGLLDLSLSAQRFMAGDEAYKLDFLSFTSADEARTREIVAAHEAWTAANECAEAAAGLTAIYEAAEQHWHLIRDLQHNIAATPAQTLAGMIVKAQAAAEVIAGDHAWIVEEHFPAILAKWVEGQAEPDRFKIRALSLVVDALRLADAATATDRAA